MGGGSDIYTGACTIKLITAIIYGTYPRVEHLKGASAPALLANIRLGWKSLAGTNTLAYDENT